LLKMLRVINIGTDRNIFDPQSGAAKRMVEYGSIFGELHIVVFALDSFGFEPTKLAPNVWVYPTQSRSKLKYITDSVHIAKAIVKNIYFGQTVLSVQDPFETGIAGVLLKRKTHLPLQMQIHTDLGAKEFYDGSILNWVRYQIARFTLPRADGIRVVRQKIANDLVERFAIDVKKIRILPIFVDILRIRDYPSSVNIKLKYPKWKKIILVVSRLAADKKVDLAIKAFAPVASRFKDAGMVIVGMGSELPKLEKLAHSYKLKDQISFENWQQDVSAYYKTSTLFLHTSPFEGFGMVLVEAAATGCPIVTTRVGIAQDILKDGKSALICPPNDVSCLSNKMVTLLENPLIYRDLVKTATEDISSLIIEKGEYLKRYKEGIEILTPKE
jgi:glycosyltransferase involved in cell wall biosynthesis